MNACPCLSCFAVRIISPDHLSSALLSASLLPSLLRFPSHSFGLPIAPSHRFLTHHVFELDTNSPRAPAPAPAQHRPCGPRGAANGSFRQVPPVTSTTTACCHLWPVHHQRQPNLITLTSINPPHEPRLRPATASNCYTYLHVSHFGLRGYAQHHNCQGRSFHPEPASWRPCRSSSRSWSSSVTWASTHNPSDSTLA